MVNPRSPGQWVSPEQAQSGYPGSHIGINSGVPPPCSCRLLEAQLTLIKRWLALPQAQLESVAVDWWTHWWSLYNTERRDKQYSKLTNSSFIWHQENTFDSEQRFDRSTEQLHLVQHGNIRALINDSKNGQWRKKTRYLRHFRDLIKIKLTQQKPAIPFLSSKQIRWRRSLYQQLTAVQAAIVFVIWRSLANVLVVWLDPDPLLVTCLNIAL